MNIYDKRIYVSVIKLTMHMKYRIFFDDKITDFSHVFFRGGGTSRPSSLFLYIYVYLLMLTWLPETVVHMFFRAQKRALFPLSGRKFRSNSIYISNPFRYVMLLLTLDLQHSVAPLFMHG